MAGSEQTYVRIRSTGSVWQFTIDRPVKAIANPATVEDALTSGQIDVAYTATPATAAIAGQAARLSRRTASIALTLDREGVDRAFGRPVGPSNTELRSRRSCHRQGHLDKPVHHPVAQHPFTRHDWYSASSDHSYPYNQAMARQLLAEAGYAHGFTLPLTVLGPMDPTPRSRRLSLRAEQRWHQGDDQSRPTIQEFIPLQMSKKLPLMVHQPLLGLSMLEFYNNYLAPTSGFNPFGVVDAEVETLMAKAADVGQRCARSIGDGC